MKIFYITNGRIPNVRAYSIHIAKMCEALAQGGASVTLVAQRREKMDAFPDIFSYYSIPKNFDVKYVPIFDAVEWDWKKGFWINQLSFSFMLFFIFLFGGRKEKVIVARDEISALLLRLLGYRVFYDMHGFPVRRLWFWRIAMSPMSGIIVTNSWKKEQCMRFFNIPEKKITIAPNGFDPKLFDITKDKKELRKELGLTTEKPIVMYTGHLYDWKGANVLLEVARIFADRGAEHLRKSSPVFVFVGGTPWDVKVFQDKARGMDNVIILGHKPYASIPRYLKAADVLVLPNSRFSSSSRHAVFSQNDTSPIKLFEYMASSRPIVASDLPSIREILSEKNAHLVKPDDTQILADGIFVVLYGKDYALRISGCARRDVQKYTWERRAEKILTFINKQLHN